MQNIVLFQSKLRVSKILPKNYSIFDIGQQKFFLPSGIQIAIKFRVKLQ